MRRGGEIVKWKKGENMPLDGRRDAWPWCAATHEQWLCGDRACRDWFATQLRDSDRAVRCST
ncbi:proline/glycine betaine ABC transporter substrate-binding protein [Sesbania bispinosa]|nr:proline/glycine betaine ABC transporter substrate-binding protein [Sesbania bispinosa]